MHTIPAKAVYVDADVRARPNCRERLARVMPFVQCGDMQEGDAREYDEAARREVRSISKRRHGKDEFGDDAVVAFTAFEPDRLDWYYHVRDAARVNENHGGVCQTAVELNLVNGCVFRCAYCGFGRRIVFPLDVERLVEGLDEAFARFPDQTLYKYSNMTDLPAFEPELGAVAPMVRRFAREDARHLMLFTKSDNVDFLLELDHGGRTIVSWSLTCDAASRLVDLRAATLAERLDAMRRSEGAGYRVRARLSPVVPVRNWRREYDGLVDALFAKASPDIVTLELLGWLDFADLTSIIDPGLLDPEAVADARDAAEEMKGVHWGPFTEAFHEAAYRHLIKSVKRRSPSTPVAVCHGTRRIWDSLGGLMEMTPENYVCNCGPTSAPGNPIYDRSHGPA